MSPITCASALNPSVLAPQWDIFRRLQAKRSYRDEAHQPPSLWQSFLGSSLTWHLPTALAQTLLLSRKSLQAASRGMWRLFHHALDVKPGRTWGPGGGGGVRYPRGVFKAWPELCLESPALRRACGQRSAGS